MKAICKRFGGSWIGLLAALILTLTFCGTAFAQTATTAPQASGSTGALAAFCQEQQSLAQQWQALVSQGATEQQVDAWRQQNAAQIAQLRQSAQALALASALQPMPLISGANIPPNASSTLKAFLMVRASLANARAQIHNQLLQSMPAGATQAQVSAMQQQEEQLFQQQHSADLRLQSQRAQTLAAEAASRPLPPPGPLNIPPNATPQLRAFLTTRNALVAAWAQTWNQNIRASPAARQAAIQQWQQQNAGSLQQLQEQTQNLSNPTQTQQEENQ